MKRSILLSQDQSNGNAQLKFMVLLVSLEKANQIYNPFRSAGTSPNDFKTPAFANSPTIGSPVRLNATAPTFPCWRDRTAAARVAELGV
jgi:hypothetical protein